MKSSKAFYVILYIVFILLLTLHFTTAFSLLYSETPFFVGTVYSFFTGLNGLSVAFFILSLVVSIALSLGNAQLLYYLQHKSMETTVKSTLPMVLINASILLLAISPLFFHSHKNSFLYSFSDNTRTHFAVVFVIFLSFLCLLLFYYSKTIHDKNSADFQHLINQLNENDTELQNEIEEDKKLLLKWQEEIKGYSKELETMENIPKEISEYYKEIEDSFQVLNVGGETP